jgi:hypothetical protein
MIATVQISRIEWRSATTTNGQRRVGVRTTKQITRGLRKTPVSGPRRFYFGTDNDTTHLLRRNHANAADLRLMGTMKTMTSRSK